MPANDVQPYLHEGTFGTGAIWRPEDPRNFNMQHLPGVGAIMPSLPAEDTHLCQYLDYTYNQGPSPSCVWHAISGIQTANEKIERRGERLIFDAMAMHRATGDPNQGRYTGDMLKIAQDQGTLLAGSNKRYRIGTYAFSPKGSPEEWVNTAKAAIVAGYICGLALRLPSNFSAESGGTVLGWDTYHEVILCGFRPTPGQFGSWRIKNSWGNWGDAGFAWLPIDLTLWNNYQEGAAFINTIIDGIDDDLAPLPPNPQPPTPPEPTPPTPPPPARRVVVTAVATGGGLEMLKVGTPLAASGGGFQGNLNPTSITIYDDPTPTPPNPSPPDPTPPTPPDPGGLKIDSQARGSGLYVLVRDAAGASVGATVSVNVAGVQLMAFNKHTGSNVPATFLVGRNHGQAQIQATTDDGRSVQGTQAV